MYAFSRTIQGKELTSWVNYQINHQKDSISFHIKNCPLSPGDYSCTIFSEINNNISDWIQNAINFTIVEKDYYNTGKLLPFGQGNILLNYTIAN